MHQATLGILKKFSLLVVEDDEIARMMIKQALKPYCESFYEANDGLVGIELFKKHRIDIIVTDIHLPSFNGFEMIKEILKLKPEQLFIVMTSFDTDQNIIHSMNEGACHFLRKPINIKELQTALLMTTTRLTHSLKYLSSDIVVDFRKELILQNNKPIFLSQKQHKIFWLLCYNIGRLVTYEMFEEYIYDGESIKKSVLHVSILRIKQQLSSIIIESSVNMGYILKINKPIKKSGNF